MLIFFYHSFSASCTESCTFAVFLADWAVRVFNIFMGPNKYKIGLSVHTLQCIVVSARKS